MAPFFLISFDSFEHALKAEKLLSEIYVDNEINLFGEIDNRGKDIYVVLTYSCEIKHHTCITFFGNKTNLYNLVTFVAIKNGEHQSKGYAYFSDGLSEFLPDNDSHVSSIHKTVIEYFGIHN